MKPREKLSEMATKRPRPGYRPRPRSAPQPKPITRERIEHALTLMAYIISTTNKTQFTPIMERLERELETYRNAADPISRARKILEDHTIEGSTPKLIR
jgi:hypothetical protein